MTEPADRSAPEPVAEEPIVDYPGVHEEATPPQPLAQRLRDPKTIISIVLPIVIVVLAGFFVFGLNQKDPVTGLTGFEQMAQSISRSDPLLLLGALAIYYLGFPLRGYRWMVLLRGSGAKVGMRDSTEIIFISWLVNCLVPAKLGDVYRAYLLRLNFAVSLSRTFGTVFIERIFDLFAIVLLGLAAGFWSFRTGMPTAVQIVFAVGIGVVILLAVALFVIRNFGSRIIVKLPLPHRVLEFYERFEEGVFSIDKRRVPLLAFLTAAIWTTEAMRLFLVIQALGFGDLQLGISGAFFVALISSLLTAVPFTPAGVGLVEVGVAGILVNFYSASTTEAGAIVLVDRAISVLSIIVLGGLTYIFSSKTRGRAVEAPLGERG